MEQKILFVDIESTNLWSSIGNIVCVGIFDPKKFQEPVIFFVRNHKEEVRALSWLKEQLEKNGYNAICGWNSRGYDVPFLIGRAVKLGFEFPELVKILNVDLYEISKNVLKLHSYKMEDVCHWLEIPFDSKIKGFMIHELYQRSLSGDKDSENRIKERCTTDLLALSKLFEKLKTYSNLISK